MKFNIKVSLTTLFIISIMIMNAYTKTEPMKVRKTVEIPDGEHLYYSVYSGGDKKAEFDMVTRYISSNQVKAYLNQYQLNNKETKVTDYKKFSWYAVIDLSSASMVRYQFDKTDYYVASNQAKGLYYYDINFGSTYSAVARYWDGYESREQVYRSKKIDTSYPLWYYDAFVFWGGRLLDWDQGGHFNLFNPATKDPVKATLLKIGSQKLKTASGELEADKVVWTIADPFLATLLKQFTDAMVYYIEKGPKKRLLKWEMEIGGETWILEKDTLEK